MDTCQKGGELGERWMAKLPEIMTKNEQDGFQRLQIFVMFKTTTAFF